MPTALITGITGQDGSYLAELLLSKGYRVAGTTRDRRRIHETHVAPFADRLDLLEVSLDNSEAIAAVVRDVQPDEVYNLAGQTRIADSWKDPVASAEVNAIGAARVLDAVCSAAPSSRLFEASSCEIFAPADVPLREGSTVWPTSPYGAAKLCAQALVGAYRAAGKLYAAAGILFNHESPRRDESFVTRKISRAVARIAHGTERELRLGNLDARRDWGFAGDYVEAMWLMLQQDTPEDLVIGTGESHSVGEFCDAAFSVVGLDYRDFVVSDPALMRQGEAAVRIADPTRARTRLGWAPRVSFADLVKMMVESEMHATSR